MRIAKNILAVMFAGAALIAAFAVIHDLVVDEPSKINNEWQTRLIMLIIPVVFAVFCSVIAYGLLRSRRWSFYLYTVLFACWTLFCIYLIVGSSLDSFISNMGSNLLGIVVLIGIPLLVELLMLRIKDRELAK